MIESKKPSEADFEDEDIEAAEHIDEPFDPAEIKVEREPMSTAETYRRIFRAVMT
jgi:hypothetical protein